MATDSFTVEWNRWIIYAIPPFCLPHRTLCKLEEDQVEGIVILPHWPIAVWCPQMLRLLTQKPILLPRGKQVLQLSHSDTVHLLHRKLQLLAVVLSGKWWKHKAFLKQLAPWSVYLGEIPPVSWCFETSQPLGVTSGLTDSTKGQYPTDIRADRFHQRTVLQWHQGWQIPPKDSSPLTSGLTDSTKRQYSTDIRADRFNQRTVLHLHPEVETFLYWMGLWSLSSICPPRVRFPHRLVWT